MGRNWTRRSIEEIFDDMFRRHAKPSPTPTGNQNAVFIKSGAGDLELRAYWVKPEDKPTANGRGLTLRNSLHALVDVLYNQYYTTTGLRIYCMKLPGVYSSGYDTYKPTWCTNHGFALSGNNLFRYVFLFTNDSQGGVHLYRIPTLSTSTAIKVIQSSYQVNITDYTPDNAYVSMAHLDTANYKTLVQNPAISGITAGIKKLYCFIANEDDDNVLAIVNQDQNQNLTVIENLTI